MQISTISTPNPASGELRKSTHKKFEKFENYGYDANANVNGIIVCYISNPATLVINECTTIIIVRKLYMYHAHIESTHTEY